MPLSEEEIDYLEAHIPELADAAFTQAYWQALAAGSSVMISEGGALYEVFPNGERRFVKHVEPPMRVTVGEKWVLR